jgi:hypothetical protein
VHTQLERRGAGAQGGQRADQVVHQRQLRQGLQRGHRSTGGRGIGGVGIHRHRRLLATQQPGREVGREDQHELHPAFGHQALGLGFSDDLGDAEVAGVLGRAHDAAHQRAVVVRHHRGGQLARVAVDGITEQHQLHDRHADQHREGQAVAAQLHQLLAQHRHDAAPAEPGPFTAMAATGSCPGHVRSAR